MDSVRCTPEMKHYISTVDLIIFDIDGVLIDTIPSFIATIVETTCYYINTILGLPVDLSGLSESDALEFKKFTGFNNDWDLTEGLVTYQLFLYKKVKKFDNLTEFLQAADKNGGGLDGIAAIVSKYCDAETNEWINKNVDRDLIRKTFQEFYGGGTYCESLYGFTPQNYKGRGNMESERVLLDSSVMQRWNGAIGILTGRMGNETELALKMLPINGIDRNLVQYADHELPDKPHPAKISRIIRSAQSSFALYIGDSIDDFLTVVNYNRLKERRGELQFGLVSANSENFPDQARSFQAASVNPLIEFIVKYRE